MAAESSGTLFTMVIKNLIIQASPVGSLINMCSGAEVALSMLLIGSFANPLVHHDVDGV